MSKLPLDLSKFRKVKSDSHATILKHPDGHEFKIAHKKLSSQIKSQLESLEGPAMAKGGEVKHYYNAGEVSGSEEKAPLADTPEQIAADASMNPVVEEPSLSKKAGQYLGNAVVNSIKDTAGAVKHITQPISDFGSGFFYGDEPKAGEAPLSAEAGSPAPSQGLAEGVNHPAPPSNPDPYGAMSALQGQLGGLKKVGQGTQAEHLALGQQGLQNATQEEAYQKQQAQNFIDYQQASEPILKARQALLNDIQNQHINPKQYIDNMSTGGKIASGIGMLLSGMGSGLTGGTNLAYNYIQNQINNDINAQKVELGKKENLLSHNFQQTHNLMEAYNLTKMQTQDVLSSHLRQIADQTQDPVEKARALQAAGQMDQQTAQLTHQMAMQRMLMGQQSGQDGQMNPVLAIKMLAPPGEQNNLMKELQTKQNMESASKSLMDAFDYAAKNNTVLNKLNPQAQSKLQGMIDAKLLGLAHSSAGRFNMEEIPYVRGQFPKATDTPDTIAEKRKVFQQTLAEKAHFPSLEAYGVRSNMPETAQAEPQVQTMNGKRYVRRGNYMVPVE